VTGESQWRLEWNESDAAQVDSAATLDRLAPYGRSKPSAKVLGEIMDSVYTKFPIPGWPPL
jgi:hypothetical protein